MMNKKFTNIFSLVKDYLIPTQDVVRTTANLSISDGAFWAVYSSMTGLYVVPLSILLLGPNAPVGYIMGLPVLLVPLAQHISIKVSRKVEDLKRLTVIITFFDRLLWVPVVFLVFISGYDVRFIFLIILLSLRTFFASFSGTTWTLWVPTVIPGDQRTTYFAKRNTIMKIFSVFGYLFALGLFLRIPDKTIAIISVMLIGSLVFSTISLFIMTRIPSFRLSQVDRNSNGKISEHFSRFLIFSSIWALGSSIVMPYFQLMIVSREYLGETQIFYTVIFLILSTAAILTQLWWGSLSRKSGNLTTIFASGAIYVVGVTTLFFIVTPLIAIIPAILMGAGSSGMQLAMFNEMVARSEASRIRSVSSYNLYYTLASALGPISANLAFNIKGFSLFSVFMLSLLLMAASLVLLKVIGQREAENKTVQKDY